MRYTQTRAHFAPHAHAHANAGTRECMRARPPVGTRAERIGRSSGCVAGEASLRRRNHAMRASTGASMPRATDVCAPTHMHAHAYPGAQGLAKSQFLRAMSPCGPSLCSSVPPRSPSPAFHQGPSQSRLYGLGTQALPLRWLARRRVWERVERETTLLCVRGRRCRCVRDRGGAAACCSVPGGSWPCRSPHSALR